MESSYAEDALVGLTLLDPTCYNEAGLSPDHFLNPRNKVIWRAIHDTIEAGDPVDEITVGDRIPDHYNLSYSELSALTTSAPGGEATSYAQKVLDAWHRRQLAAIGENLHRQHQLKAPVNEILDSIRKRLDEIEANSGRSLPTLAELVEAEQESIRCDRHKLELGEPLLRGLSTGLGIDAVVPGGIPTDKVTIIYGESGNFKTTTKNNLVWNIAQSGLGTVLDISLEDSDELTTQRFISSQTGVPYGRVATRNLDDSSFNSVSALSVGSVASNVIMGAEIPPNIDEIVRIARHYKRTRGLIAVVVDYIQLLGYEPELLTKVMQKAQLSAKRDKIAYIFVSQVKQDVDQRDDHRPKLSDMFGSSAMRIYSKLSIGVYRPYQYEKVPGKKSPYRNLFENHHEGSKIYPQVMELWVQKNVLGESGVMVPILVDPKTGKMRPMPAELKAMLA